MGRCDGDLWDDGSVDGHMGDDGKMVWDDGRERHLGVDPLDPLMLELIKTNKKILDCLSSIDTRLRKIQVFGTDSSQD